MDAFNAMNAREEQEVRRLGEAIGYGRLMQLAEQIWSEKAKEQGTPGSEHTTGPCAAFIVTCPHTFKDRNGHCDICCGSGRITRWVFDNLAVLENGR